MVFFIQVSCWNTCCVYITCLIPLVGIRTSTCIVARTHCLFISFHSIYFFAIILFIYWITISTQVASTFVCSGNENVTGCKCVWIKYNCNMWANLKGIISGKIHSEKFIFPKYKLMKWINKLTKNWNDCSNLLFKTWISGSAFVLLQNGSTVYSWVMTTDDFSGLMKIKPRQLIQLQRLCFTHVKKDLQFEIKLHWSALLFDIGQMPLQPSALESSRLRI